MAMPQSRPSPRMWPGTSVSRRLAADRPTHRRAGPRTHCGAARRVRTAPQRWRARGPGICASGAILGHQTVDEHDDQRADHREQDGADAPRVVEDAADAVASQEAADESADDRADDTQDDRHPEAHGLLARHDGAGDEADDRADDDPGDDCPEKTHERNSVLSGEGIGGAVASMAAHSPKSPYRRQNRWSRSRPCGPQGRSDSSRG